MTIDTARIVYSLKAGNLAIYADPAQSKMLSPRVAILKNWDGRRLACVVESKKGFTVDLVKKMHRAVKDYGWCVRDERGRFVSKKSF